MSDKKSDIDYILTTDEQKLLADAIEEATKDQEDFNKEVAEQKAKEPAPKNKKITVNTETNIATGETVLTGDITDDIDFDNEDSGFDKLAEFGSSLNKTSDNFTITGEEIDDTINHTDLYSGMLKGMQLSKDTLDTLAKLANQKGEDISRIFTINDLPTEVRSIITIAESVNKKAPEDITEKLNDDADTIITELYSSVSTKMTIDYANKETTKAFAGAQNEIFPLLQDYTNKRNEMIRKALKDVPDNDKDKQYVTDCLDAMADSYNMDKLKEFAYKCKIKKFQLEKPNKVFDTIHNKYRTPDAKYNIYSLTSALPVLSNHLSLDNYISAEDAENNTTAKKFLIAFTRFCMNFDVENTYQRTYMYYTLYYIYLLTTYKGIAYDKFAKPFLTNVVEVANHTH